MNTASSQPLLVVGAGPAGLVMASELRRYGMPVRIIDKAAAPTVHSKALAVWPRSLEMLDDMGAVEGFVQEGVPIHAGHFYANGEQIAEVKFTGLNSPYPNGIVVPQSRTEALLTAHLATFGTTIERETELLSFVERGDEIHASLKRIDGTREDVVTPWIIGCDGAHSVVRKSLGFTFSGSTYEEGFWLMDASLETTLAEDGMHLFLHDEGSLVWFPLGGGRYRAVANVPPAAAADSSKEPTVEELQQLINTRMSIPAKIIEATWLAAFRVNHRQSSSYRLGRSFLAGDAAHIHSPAGGQGMNTGMQDAYNLAWKIALVHSGAVAPTFLDSYEVERAPIARGVIDMAHTMTNFATLKSWPLQQIRNHFLHWATGLNAFQAKFSGTLAEIDFGYGKSPIIEEHWASGALSLLPGATGGGIPVGDRVPPTKFIDVAGDVVDLYELLKMPDHVILFFAGEGPGRNAALDIYDDLCGAIAEKYPELFSAFLILPGEGISTRHGDDVLLDPENAAHTAYGAGTESAIYLMRPDSYIGYREKPPQRGRLLEYIAKHFVPQAE